MAYVARIVNPSFRFIFVNPTGKFRIEIQPRNLGYDRHPVRKLYRLFTMVNVKFFTVDASDLNDFHEETISLEQLVSTSNTLANHIDFSTNIGNHDILLSVFRSIVADGHNEIGIQTWILQPPTAQVFIGLKLTAEWSNNSSTLWVHNVVINQFNRGRSSIVHSGILTLFS